MYEEWSTLKKLIWFYAIKLKNKIKELIVTGVSPLSLPNAVASHIKSLIQYGKSEQASAPTPTNPVDIYCNNGALKMLNLANMTENNIVVGKYINNSGVPTNALSNFYYAPLIPVKSSATYTLKTSRSLNYSNFMEYDANKDFIKRTLYGSADTPAGDMTTHTTDATTAYIRFGSNINGSTLTAEAVLAIEWMLTEGNTAMDYVPYGQLSTIGTPEVIIVSHADSTTETAGAEDLFAVGDYKDTQELIAGAVGHAVKAYALTGDETVTSTMDGAGNTRFIVTIPNALSTTGRTACLSTHYVYASSGNVLNSIFLNYGKAVITANGYTTAQIPEYKAFLAAQYAAGTPVIVIYPLAEPTIETVTGQPLSTTAGTNIVSVTAEVSDIELEVIYKGE